MTGCYKGGVEPSNAKHAGNGLSNCVGTRSRPGALSQSASLLFLATSKNGCVYKHYICRRIEQ